MKLHTSLRVLAVLTLAGATFFAHAADFTVAYQTTVDPAKVAQAEGAYEKATRARIDWRTFDNGADVITAIAPGDVQISYLGSSPLTAAATRKLPVETFLIATQIGAGRITLDGVAVKGPSAERGVVFQDDALLPWQKVLANVAFGLQLAGVPRTQRESIARKMLALVDLAGFEQRRVWQLSGGQRYAAGESARAIKSDPRFIETREHVLSRVTAAEWIEPPVPAATVGGAGKRLAAGNQGLHGFHALAASGRQPATYRPGSGFRCADGHSNRYRDRS